MNVTEPRFVGHPLRVRFRAMSGSPRLQLALSTLLVSVSYYLGAQLGFALDFPGTPLSIFWPPNAILLGALLCTPRVIWPIILLAALPAHLAVELNSGVPLRMVLSWFVSNGTEALFGAACTCLTILLLRS